LAEPAIELFEELFFKTFSRKRSAEFVATVRKAYSRKQWPLLLKALGTVCDRVAARLEKEWSSESAAGKPAIRAGWAGFRVLVDRFGAQVRQAEKSFAFSFVEGVLVKAIRQGESSYARHGGNLESKRVCVRVFAYLQAGSLCAVFYQ
jgi:midasin